MIASILIMGVIVMAIYLIHVATRKVPKGQERNLGFLAYRETLAKPDKAAMKPVQGGRPRA